MKHIAYWRPGWSVRISGTTREIIEKYYQWKLREERDRPSNITDDEAGE